MHACVTLYIGLSSWEVTGEHRAYLPAIHLWKDKAALLRLTASICLSAVEFRPLVQEESSCPRAGMQGGTVLLSRPPHVLIKES